MNEQLYCICGTIFSTSRLNLDYIPNDLLQCIFSIVNFDRTDIYSGKETCHDDIKFEQASVLHNLGALHAELGAKDERISDEV